ncbi:sigma-70 family RNA polymerase sigma factor [Fimbriiglobus ruber]|nr:sigma-70 family RNA polymerase sigma factor [Fimbriiglobus ruber]
MATIPATVGRLLTVCQPSPSPDAVLVARFVAHRDDAAFAELAHRHGQMVLSVARRSVRDPHLAEDVAQAVFLVLARKAGRLTRPDRLAGWLFGVTRRLAQKAAVRHHRDAGRTCPLTDMPATPDAPSEWNGLTQMLDEELVRLPEAERVSLVLCYLEGLTQDEAARSCGWSVRTLRRRLTAGRERLRERLQRRGAELGTVLAALAVAPATDAGVIGRLVAVLNGAVLSNRVMSLARAEFLSVGWGKVAGWVVAAVAVVGFAAGLVAGFQPESPPPTPTPAGPAAQPPAAAGAEPVAAKPIQLGSTELHHPDILTHLRFSKDGKELISYGRGKVRRWDSRTGAAVRAPGPLHDVQTSYDKSLLFADGTRVLSSHVDNDPERYSVREYDLINNRFTKLFDIPSRPGPNGPPDKFGPYCELSPDETLLVEGHRGAAYVWDLKKNAVRYRLAIPGPHSGDFVFTPDGKFLLSVDDDEGTVNFWNPGTGEKVKALAQENPGKVGFQKIAVSHDGHWLVMAGDNRSTPRTGSKVIFWDLEGKQGIRERVLPDELGVDGTMSFGPNGTLYVASVPIKKWGVVVTKWDVAEGTQLARWDGQHIVKTGMLTLTVSPDGKTFAIGTYEGGIHLINTNTGREVVSPERHAVAVVGVSFDPTGTEVQTVSANGSVMTWNSRTSRLQSRLNPLSPGEPQIKQNPGAVASDKYTTIVASPDGQWLLTQHAQTRPYKRVTTLWSTGPNAMTYSWDIDLVRGFIPVPGGKRVVCRTFVSGGDQLRAWDVAAQSELPDIKRTFDAIQTQYVISSDGMTIVCCDEVSAAGFDLKTGRERFSWKLADHGVLGRPIPEGTQRAGLIRALALSPDGKTLAISIGGAMFLDPTKWKNHLVLVETETGKVLRRSSTTETFGEWLAYSPDGKWIAGPGCVWNAATLKEVRRFPELPTATAGAFSPDGKRVAIGYVNGTAAVWPVNAE